MKTANKKRIMAFGAIAVVTMLMFTVFSATVTAGPLQFGRKKILRKHLYVQPKFLIVKRGEKITLNITVKTILGKKPVSGAVVKIERMGLGKNRIVKRSVTVCGKASLRPLRIWRIGIYKVTVSTGKLRDYKPGTAFIVVLPNIWERIEKNIS